MKTSSPQFFSYFHFSEGAGSPILSRSVNMLFFAVIRRRPFETYHTMLRLSGSGVHHQHHRGRSGPFVSLHIKICLQVRHRKIVTYFQEKDVRTLDLISKIMKLWSL